MKVNWSLTDKIFDRGMRTWTFAQRVNKRDCGVIISTGQACNINTAALNILFRFILCREQSTIIYSISSQTRAHPLLHSHGKHKITGRRRTDIA